MNESSLRYCRPGVLAALKAVCQEVKRANIEFQFKKTANLFLIIFTRSINRLLLAAVVAIGHVQNEQGTGYEYSISIELKNGPHHPKGHPKIS